MYNELIDALRNCADYSDCGTCKLNGKFNCADMMMRDAADALEAADKRIAELMPKRGAKMKGENDGET